MIQQLFESYKGEYDFYIETLIVAGGMNFNRQRDRLYDQLCTYYCKSASQNCPPDELEIDLFGWSRGAVMAITLASRLNQPGCKCKIPRKAGFGTQVQEVWIKPVPVRYLGIIDPVTTGLSGGEYNVRVPSNVQHGYWAIADLFERSIKGIAFALGHVLPSGNTGVLTIKHYSLTHEHIGFDTTVYNDIKADAKSYGVPF